MRNFKFLMVLVILLAGCICIGSAFATNVTDISDVSVSDVTITDEVEIVYADSIQNNAEFTSLQSNEGNFIDLKQKIYNAIDGDTILLDKNYKYLESDDMLDGLIINKTLTIDGQGHTINGSNLARAFNVSANNVIIKNINFIDCSAIKEGGAIYWFGVDGSVSGCNFTDCSAEFGGAIEWYEIANGSVSGCIFTNCNAKDCGGAIIWFGVDGSVSGCSFANCSSSSGGAVYWALKGSICGCNFTNCNAVANGGAVSCYNDDTVSGCSFVDCSAGYGGAINWNAADGSVSDCSFTNCDAQSGGAIFWVVPVGDSVSGCSFVDCYADGSVSACSFMDCSATYGGAIIWMGAGGNVSGCNFTNCNANRTGGAIDWNNGTNGSVSGCSFVDCSAIWGGAIDWDDSPDGSVSGCSFVDCSATYGGAIYINQESLSISNCTSTLSVKAPIYNEGTILSDVIITTLNADVKNVNYGETINLTGTVTTCGMSVAGQELSFKVNGNQINAESDDYGIYSTSYTVDFVGDKNVDATYEGSTGPEIINNGKLISSKVDVIVTVDDVKGKVGDKVKFTAKVHDIYGNPVQGGVVIFGFNGKEYKANVMNGVATIEVVLSKAGTYSATAYYDGDENYNDDYVIFDVDVINGSNPNPNPINKSGIPMEHTGNPLIVLLIALITLPILRRK